MTDITTFPNETAPAGRSEEIFLNSRNTRLSRIDRTFAVLMVAQWIFAIAIALTLSPYAWEGKIRTTHTHVWAALLLGGALTLFPVALAIFRPGRVSTRHVIAISQMLWSALLIHLSGGRIETHFHVFGSLAFLAAYIDWRVLVTATIVVVTDHLARGLLWPESVYGIANPEWWRFLEHASWVAFENVVLAWLCVMGVREARIIARRQAEVEMLSESERKKTAALEKVLSDLGAERELVRREAESRRVAEAFAKELGDQSAEYQQAFLSMRAERDAAQERLKQFALAAPRAD